METRQRRLFFLLFTLTHFGYSSPQIPRKNRFIVTLDVSNAERYYIGMPIKSFKCEDTQALFLGQRIARWINIERPALRKLEQLDWSAVLKDLRVPPGNRLEALKGRRKGQYSIRINEQWRVCFVWTTDGPKNVEIVDYH